MGWFSGFAAFRVRTLAVSILVVYILVRRAKLSPVEKQGVWASGLVFFLLRLAIELVAQMQGFWEYEVPNLAIFGLPVDVMAAMAVFFGSGAALAQHYFLPKGRLQVIMAHTGLALIALLYELGGAAQYGYLAIASEGYLLKGLTFFALTLLSGTFFTRFVRRFATEL